MTPHPGRPWLFELDPAPLPTDPPTHRPPRRRRAALPVILRTIATTVQILGQLITGPVTRAATRARDLALQVIGMGLLSYAAWMLAHPAGFAIAGLSLLYLQWLLTDQHADPEQPPTGQP